MVPYLGDFSEDQTVFIVFNTFSSDDPSASVTITNLADTDIHIHKDDGTTQHSDATDVDVQINFDSITGNHMIELRTDATFFTTGADYFVRMEGTTVDAATINAWIAHFSIENRHASVTANAILTDTGTTLQAELDGIQADTEDIQSRLPAALVSGRIDASVGAVAANAITATGIASNAITAAKIASNAITAAKIATDAITAAKIAANAIGASELAADAVAEIADAVWQESQGDHTDVGTFGEVATEVASILNDTDLIDDGTSGLAKIATDVAAILEDTGTTLDALIDAIKAKTDSLNFGVAGKVDANITHINEAEVTGDGDGTPWDAA